MKLWDCIHSRRSIRIFKRTPVERTVLLEMVDAARLSPSAANIQPLRYKLITDASTLNALYPHVHYAGYLPDFNPTPEQCPTAFIAVLSDTRLCAAKACECDAGLSMMSMCLVARSHGFDTVILGAIERERIRALLGLGEELALLSLLGVGVADQRSEAVPLADSIKYTMDAEGNISVPKRALGDVLIEE